MSQAPESTSQLWAYWQQQQQQQQQQQTLFPHLEITVD